MLLLGTSLDCCTRYVITFGTNVVRSREIICSDPGNDYLVLYLVENHFNSLLCLLIWLVLGVKALHFKQHS